jgi:hypothetical protein
MSLNGRRLTMAVKEVAHEAQPAHGEWRMTQSLGTSADYLGYLGALCVLTAFSVRQLSLLRAISIIGNITFIAYAAAAGLAPVLLMNSVLLLMNLYRLAQLWQDKRRTQRGKASQWAKTRVLTRRVSAAWQ